MQARGGAPLFLAEGVGACPGSGWGVGVSPARQPRFFWAYEPLRSLKNRFVLQVHISIGMKGVFTLP
jgi:hypothetical protein